MSFFIAILDSIMIFYIFLCGLGSAGIMLGIPFTRNEMTSIISNVIMNEYYYPFWFFASMFFLFTALLSVFFRRKRSVPSFDDVITFSRKGTIIQISNSAITEHIVKIVKSIEGVQSVDIKVIPLKGDKITVKVHLSLWDGSSYPEINDQIQEMVRSKTAGDLGLDNIKSIPVVLDKIVPSKTTAVPVEEEVVIDQ